MLDPSICQDSILKECGPYNVNLGWFSLELESELWSEGQGDTILRKLNQQSEKQDTDSAYDCVACDQVKTRLSKWQAEAEE